MLLSLVPIVLLMPLAVNSIFTNEIGSGMSDFCPSSQTSCEFDWDVENRQTMMHYDDVIARPVIWRNGKFWKRQNCADNVNDIMLNDTDLASNFLLMADGDYKYVHVVNKMMPGPTIVAYEGQEIVVNVTNKMWQQGTGIHWHGMIQKDTNWMDGVPSVTQCAINPMETFTYRFIAEPAGTHWWHSHEGVQRADGYFGGLIVLPHPNRPSPVQTANPKFAKEFIMMVNDWQPGQENLAVTSFMNDLKPYMYDLWNKTGQCFGGSAKAPNGVSAATFRFNSALINGKGWKFDSNNQPLVDTPLEMFNVAQNMHYRFRVINAASSYAFKISVDNHPLTIIASDGKDLQPVTADSFIINAGERFDFYIYTNQTVANYWIRAETIEVTPHYTVAVLKYSGAGTAKPTSSKTCMMTSCKIVNCPFTNFFRGPEENSTCINFEQMKSLTPYTKTTGSNFVEHFIAFEKTDSRYNRRYDTANGIMYINPSTPPAVAHEVRYDEPCDPVYCSNNPCQCTNQINVPLDHTVQIVLLANTTHPIHLHGHYFEVIKIGYAPAGHDPVTFLSSLPNPDYRCNNALCNKATWTNSTWQNDNVPGTNLVDPPIKDTITIPAYGYVVLRFKTTNPGWWLMHCHIETHLVQGMGLIFQSGEVSQIKPPPRGFPKCGTYQLSQADFMAAKNGQTMSSASTTPAAEPESSSEPEPEGEAEFTDREMKIFYGYIGVGLMGILLGVLFTIAYLYCCKGSSANSYKM